MSFKGGSQQPQQSMNAKGVNAHVLHHAALYVIHDGHGIAPLFARTEILDERQNECISHFAEIIDLKVTNLREFSENSIGQKVIKLQDHRDLEKLQKMDLPHGENIHLVFNENLKFDTVRKLPWILHNKGLTPMFFEANKNTHWRKVKIALRKLHDKGVVMPIDLMAIVRWQINYRNWLKRMLLCRTKEALEAKAALYLLGIQVLPPYSIHERDFVQLQRWVAEGILMPQPKATNNPLA